MNYQIVQPHPSLRSLVHHYWTLEPEKSKGVLLEINTVVDNSSGIIAQHTRGKSAVFNEKGRPIRTCFLFGQVTQPGRYFVRPEFSIAGVKFHPHGIHRLFGIPAMRLTNKRTRLKEIGGEELESILLSEDNAMVGLGQLEAYLLSRLPLQTGKEFRLFQALSQLHSHPELYSVTDLTDLLGISTRQLERKFNQVIGVSPSYYLRVMRFQKALVLIRSGEFSKYSDIAYALNYTDQSHFIKEVKHFSGMSPKKLYNLKSESFGGLSAPLLTVSNPVML
jgi:AraC-like DNA-binding protein